MKRRAAQAAGLVACVAGLVGCDHATKIAAEAALRDHTPVPVVPGVVELSLTENRDVAFGSLARLSLHAPAWALAIAVGVVTACIVVAWLRRRAVASRTGHAAFAMIVAGALGNAIDRVARGHVVDFVHVRFWPVFNVADVLVVAGVALLLLSRRARTQDRAMARTPDEP